MPTWQHVWWVTTLQVAEAAGGCLGCNVPTFRCVARIEGPRASLPACLPALRTATSACATPTRWTWWPCSRWVTNVAQSHVALAWGFGTEVSVVICSWGSGMVARG